MDACIVAERQRQKRLTNKRLQKSISRLLAALRKGQSAKAVGSRAPGTTEASLPVVNPRFARRLEVQIAGLRKAGLPPV